MILAAAYSHELPRYGLEVGLTNYAAGVRSFATKKYFCLKFLCFVIV
uniref:Uncharacterized protein n=1 Tax=Nelumbo nucifera TaxID=4432 RepID=A0A822ZIV1_NELNU|nr:TPA_asm: hypothetical protein HUJ06_001625 [Nelumbo nucifera]